MNIAGFEKVAQYLTHPLVLVGFVLMLAYGVHTQLMKSGLLRQVSQKDSGLIIRLFLRYGFWLALILVLAGFGLPPVYSFLFALTVVLVDLVHKHIDSRVQPVDAGRVAEKLLAPLQGQLEAKDEQIKALTEAITALSKTDAPAKSINDAFRALEQGDTKQAQAIFAEVLRTKEAEGRKANKEAAAVARHLGALAYINDTKAALTAYRKAVELDPDNAADWTWLGLLLHRTGELAQAEEAYRKVLALGKAHQDKEEQAMALGNLGSVYMIRGELDKAEEMYRKTLELHEALGSKEGIAANYGNLGNVYYKRGELDRAEEMYSKALAFKEGMASWYSNLGNVYKKRGDLDQAAQMYKKSLHLFQEMKHPSAKVVQQALDDLA